jgi:hypothetical protein
MLSDEETSELDIKGLVEPALDDGSCMFDIEVLELERVEV